MQEKTHRGVHSGVFFHDLNMNATVDQRTLESNVSPS